MRVTYVLVIAFADPLLNVGKTLVTWLGTLSSFPVSCTQVLCLLHIIGKLSVLAFKAGTCLLLSRHLVKTWQWGYWPWIMHVAANFA